MSSPLQALRSILGDRVSTAVPDLLSYSADNWPPAMKWAAGPAAPNLPAAVVWPESTEEVAGVLRLAAQQGVPVVPYGGGSNVVGAAIPAPGAIVLDTKRMRRVIDLNDTNRTVTAQAGIIASELEEWLLDRGYTLGHYPQSLYRATLGGMIATRATGTFSGKYGGMEHRLLGLEAVLPTGDIVRTKVQPRATAGPDLNQIFLGSEGAFGVVTEATVKIAPVPERRAFRCYAFRRFRDGLEAIRRMIQGGVSPAVIRLYNEAEGKGYLEAAGAASDQCFLLLGFDGYAEMVEVEAARADRTCREHGALALSEEVGVLWERNRFSTCRMSGTIATSGGISDAIEMANGWDRLPGMIESITERLQRLGLLVHAHCSHMYENGGSVYVIFYGRAPDDEAALALYAKAWEETMSACLDHGGTIAHHHGIGLARQRWLAQELGTAMTLLRQLKRTIDPAGVLNPGRLG